MPALPPDHVGFPRTPLCTELVCALHAPGPAPAPPLLRDDRPAVVEHVPVLVRALAQAASHDDVTATWRAGLAVLGEAGVAWLLRMRRTVGSAVALPPPLRHGTTRHCTFHRCSACVASFNAPHGGDGRLTVGARALCKHAHRDASGFWGRPAGPDHVRAQQQQP